MGLCGPREQMDIKQKQAGKYKQLVDTVCRKNPPKEILNKKKTSMPLERIDSFNIAGFSLPSSPLFPVLCLLASTLWSFKETKY